MVVRYSKYFFVILFSPSSFYIECTSIKGDTIECKRPNVLIFDIVQPEKQSFTPDLPDRASNPVKRIGNSWILVVAAEKVSPYLRNYVKIDMKRFPFRNFLLCNLIK